MKVEYVLGATDKSTASDQSMRLRGFDDGDALCSWTGADGKIVQHAFKKSTLTEWVEAQPDAETVTSEDLSDLNMDDLFDTPSDDAKGKPAAAEEEAEADVDISALNMDDLFGPSETTAVAETPAEEPKEEEVVDISSLSMDDLFA